MLVFYCFETTLSESKILVPILLECLKRHGQDLGF